MAQAAMNADAGPQRSSFVTVLAITFIVLSSGSTLIGLMQNLMVNFLFPAEAFDAAATQPPGMPAVMLFMVTHMRLFFLLVLLMSAGTLVVSIGLLKRMNWARLGFIALMALGIAWHVLALVLQQQMVAAMSMQVPPMEGGAPDFGAIMMVMRVFTALFALVLSSLFAWIIYKLTRPAIAAEFS